MCACARTYVYVWSPCSRRSDRTRQDGRPPRRRRRRPSPLAAAPPTRGATDDTAAVGPCPWPAGSPACKFHGSNHAVNRAVGNGGHVQYEGRVRAVIGCAHTDAWCAYTCGLFTCNKISVGLASVLSLSLLLRWAFSSFSSQLSPPSSSLFPLSLQAFSLSLLLPPSNPPPLLPSSEAEHPPAPPPGKRLPTDTTTRPRHATTPVSATTATASGGRKANGFGNDSFLAGNRSRQL